MKKILLLLFSTAVFAQAQDAAFIQSVRFPRIGIEQNAENLVPGDSLRIELKFTVTPKPTDIIILSIFQQIANPPEYFNDTLKVSDKRADGYYYYFLPNPMASGIYDIRVQGVRYQPSFFQIKQRITAIEEMIESKKDAVIATYNLQGMQVNEPINGVYIRVFESGRKEKVFINK